MGRTMGTKARCNYVVGAGLVPAHSRRTRSGRRRAHQRDVTISAAAVSVLEGEAIGVRVDVSIAVPDQVERRVELHRRFVLAGLNDPTAFAATD